MKETFSVSKRAAYRAIDDLIEDSQPDSLYITLLILSSSVIASGLLLNNIAILIGGMLITPILTPVLLVALSFSTSKFYLLRRTLSTLIKSFLFVFGTAFVISLILGLPDNAYQQPILESSVRTAVLYFFVAGISGVAATLAWARKEASSLLPGVSIAVSLVPPLASVGMWMSAGIWDKSQFFFIVFVLNIIGIIVGSMIVFTMLGFYKTENKLSAKEIELKKEDEKKQREKELLKEAKIIQRDEIINGEDPVINNKP
jgi:uncharacterized hydrophobic protein (TIGR00271 family)